MRTALLIVLSLFVATGLVACGGASPAPDTTAPEATEAEGPAQEAKVATEEPQAGAEEPLEFIMVAHSPVTDPYWVEVAKGFEQAGADTGTTVTFRGTDANLNDPDQQRRNIEAAIAAAPDGLIISNPTPDSLNETIQKATAAGIPVILVNQGAAEVDNTGALTFVGDDPAVQGEVGANLMNEFGCSEALVVTTPYGAIPFVDLRTNGFEETFQGTTVLAEVPLNDLNDSVRVKSIMATEFQKNESIDCVFSIGSAFIAAMIEARNDLGDRGAAMRWGTIDVTEGALDALETRALDYALDAQQYSQGYYPVAILSLYGRKAVQPATKLFLTGPAVITPDNVGTLIAAKNK